MVNDSITYSDYSTKLNNLSFSIVASSITTKFSTLGECHRNCENFCQENTEAKHILGWIKQDYFGETRYLLHSCIQLNGSILNITPLPPICPSDLFAADHQIRIDPEVTKDFRFIHSITGKEFPNKLIEQ